MSDSSSIGVTENSDEGLVRGDAWVGSKIRGRIGIEPDGVAERRAVSKSAKI